MPPKKKKGESDEKPLLGRFGSSLKMGIVGLPNVGKSTFFNVLTESAVDAANYPFCTINPTDSRVAVPDARFDHLVDHHKPASKVPAFLHITDIAGLIDGASEGAGLGNAFLSHISAVDGILHMVRCFKDPDVVHVKGEVDPIRDMGIIHNELRLKDIKTIENWLGTNRKPAERSKDKRDKEHVMITDKILEFIKGTDDVAGRDARLGDWGAREIEVLNSHYLLTAKPVVYLCNCSPKDYIRKKNKHLPGIMEWIKARGANDTMIPYSAAFEQELFDTPADLRPDFLKERNTISCLPKIITTAFKGLQLEYFFTAGPDEVKAWTIRKGTKAPQAAGKIHTDFERGFIMAEVMNFEKFKEHGTEAAVKAAGLYRQQGRDYVVTDGDIILFRFNVTDSKKK